MQISGFSVSKYKSSTIFCRFAKKSVGSVLSSSDGRFTTNMHFFWSKAETAYKLFHGSETSLVYSNFVNKLMKGSISWKNLQKRISYQTLMWSWIFPYEVLQKRSLNQKVSFAIGYWVFTSICILYTQTVH